MNLVDSCGWVEFFCDSPLAGKYAHAIEITSDLVVPTVCVYEVVKKILTEVGEQEALQAMATMRRGHVEELTDQLAVSAAFLSRQHKLPMADAVVYATARRFGATIWTQDSHFKTLSSVKYFGK
ncbi:MAG: VapC toxin family PIN domain ribonuclease [Anaerolinea sp.]|nr:VapC toxin family PIN domain ribonuclease [Anaerolinea sp.]